MRHFLNALRCSCAKCNKIAQDEELEKKKSQEQKDKEKKVDDLQNANEEEIKKQEEEKEKHLESIRKSLRKLSSQELDDELFKLQSELHDLKKQLNEPDEEKLSKSASLEYLGYDSSLITKSKNSVKRYNVLLLEPYESVTHSGDRLLMKMGSTDSDSVSDTSGDELLKSLGSVD